jgi:hypothetical protein
MHHHSARIAALSAIFIALALAALSAADAQQQLSAKWSNTVSSSRYLHGTYTRLHNGSVLAVGGSVAPTAEEARSAEIYNPTTGVWRETSPMNYQRQFHEAHLLPDGRALVIGGYTPNVGPAPVYAGPPEVFDPATGKVRVALIKSLVNLIFINLLLLVAATSNDVAYLCAIRPSAQPGPRSKSRWPERRCDPVKCAC